MTDVALYDRRIGIFQPAPRVGNDYPRTTPKLAGQLGRWPEVYSVFLDLTTDYTGKPGSVAPHVDVEQAVTADGQDLLVALQLIRVWADRGDGVYVPRHATGAEILAGVYDAPLTALFTALCALRKPDASAPWIDTRPAWEANVLGSYFFPADSPNQLTSRLTCGTAPDGKMANYNRVWTNDAGDPIIAGLAQYKAVIAYLHTLFATISSRIRLWVVFGANDARAEMNRGAAGVTAVNLYPGDAHCYGVGFDNYEALQTIWWGPARLARGVRYNDLEADLAAEIGVTITRAVGAQKAYSYAYDMLQEIAPTKPVMIGEINCAEPGDPLGPAAFGAGQSKAQWYTDFWNLPASWCPNIVSINWFNSPGTRKYYPFDSSTAAFAAFQAGFTQRSSSSTWRVAPAWVPPDGEISAPPDPSDDLSRDALPGDPDIAKKVNTSRWWHRMTTYRGPSGKVALRGASDGTTAALQVTGDMGGLPLGPFIPLVNIVTAALTSGARKIALAIREAGDSVPRLQIRSDGRMSWGGGSGSADANLSRASAGVLLVDGANGAAATLQVDTVDTNGARFTDVGSSAPASPGTGVSRIYNRLGVPQGRTPAGEFPLIRRTPADVAAGSWLYSLDHPMQTGTQGPQMTAGQAIVATVVVPTARNLSRLGIRIQTGGSGLTGSYLAAYDLTGALLAASADLGQLLETAGFRTVTSGLSIGAAVAAAPAPIYVFAWCVSGTMPRVLGSTATDANDAGLRFGTYSGLTGAPPSTINPASIVSTANTWKLAAG